MIRLERYICPYWGYIILTMLIKLLGAVMELLIPYLKVNKHNNIIERTFILEGQMTECQHDIKDLNAYHKPT